MQYGQIVFLLFIAFLFYYAVLIILDIQKAKMAQAAEQENHSEEEIDISDEAQSFKPIKIERDEPSKQQMEDKRETRVKTSDIFCENEKDIHLRVDSVDKGVKACQP